MARPSEYTPAMGREVTHPPALQHALASGDIPPVLPLHPAVECERCQVAPPKAHCCGIRLRGGDACEDCPSAPPGSPLAGSGSAGGISGAGKAGGRL